MSRQFACYYLCLHLRGVRAGVCCEGRVKQTEAEQEWRSRESTRLKLLIHRPAVICGLSLLLVLVLSQRVFLRVLQLSSLHKNQHFQIPIRPGIRGRRRFVSHKTVKCYLVK